MTAHEPDDLSRRDFVKLLGALAAIAGVDGCNRLPAEHILPYAHQPPELTPGVAQHYATAMVLDGLATGLIVESHEGRPTKVEGNPDHPASLGAAGVFEQASVLDVYDPDRARSSRIGSASVPWVRVAATLAPAALRQRVGARGERLRLLLEPTSSPTEIELLSRVRALYPDAGVHFHQPLAGNAAAALGALPVYDLGAADVILSLGADLLAEGPFHLRYARQFADGRRLRAPSDGMNRLYVVETTLTPTGSAADHRFAVRPSEIEEIAAALWGAVGGGAAPAQRWLAAVADDLRAHHGRALVVAGDREPPRVHALVHAINAALGAVGAGVSYVAPPLAGAADPRAGLAPLVEALRAGAVDTLVCLGGNPSYDTPGDLQFGRLLRAVPNSVCLAVCENETARDCRSFVPRSHWLESWGDARALDGTLSIVQPLVRPLYESRSVAEVLAALLGDARASSLDLVRATWRRGGRDDEEWMRALQRGVVDGTASPRTTATPFPALLATAAPAVAATTSGAELEVLYARDPKVHAGSFGNNPWLQELPAPLTKLTWGNAALVSPATAARLGVATGDGIALRAGARTLRAPVLVLPGHADGAVTLHAGYGRSAPAERVAHGVGVDAYAFMTEGAPLYERVQAGADPAGAAPLAISQLQDTMARRDPARSATLDRYRADPAAAGDRQRRWLSLYDQPAPPVGVHGSPQWAMTIDTGACIGCGACAVACQAENNVPVVGPEEVRNGRLMHWLRIDRYFAGPAEAPEVLLEPMLCQQCEKAPCEYVCPVEATVHSDDGLNEMVYNRCVGTRFCSNNCPYKVRRFNWRDYNAHLSETELLVKNPDVTVRERGVMEKCTFCVQRIREAEIAAGVAGRPVRGADVRTACQQACPTNAIVFGSLTEPDSEVVRAREQPRAYSVLGELGTEPRVRYLARVRNRNPALDAGGEERG